MKNFSRRKTRHTLKSTKASTRSVGTEPDIPRGPLAGPITGPGYAEKIKKESQKKPIKWIGNSKKAHLKEKYQAPKPHDPVVWQGKDLSTDATIMFYSGKCYVRPIGRGVVLSDLKFEPHLDEVLTDGNYEIEIRVVRRLPLK